MRYSHIAIDGAHSTGKSTLWQALQLVPQLAAFAFLEETARIVAPQFGVQTADDWKHIFLDDERHGNLLRHIYLHQANSEKQHSNFIVDGSIFRIRAYATVFGLSPDDLGVSPPTNNYDLVLYCPIEFSSSTDGFRYSDKQQETDIELRNFYKMHDISNVYELHGTTEQRTQQAIRLLLDR